jgi:hypothetical protein
MANDPPHQPHKPIDIVETAMQAWADVRDVLGTITNVAIVALLISVAGDVAETLLLGLGDGALVVIGIFAIMTLQAVLLMPYVSAVLRLLVLKEVVEHYRVTPREARLRKLLVPWLVVSLGPPLLSLIPAPLQEAARAPIWLLLLLLFGWFAVRFLILFPAIATDAPNAGPRSAWIDGRGMHTRIALAVILALSPLMVVALFSYSFVLAMLGGRLGTPLQGAVAGVIDLFFITVMLAVASRLYRRLGRRLRGERE